MKPQLILASTQGMQIFQKIEDQWQVVQSVLHQHAFTAVAHSGDSIMAGSKDGLFRSTDRGQTWHPSNEGLEEKHIRSVHYHPQDPNQVLAGTQPAVIFTSRDGGKSWAPCREVIRLREKYNWNLPYAPQAGCIRGFAGIQDRVYAAVEQGGLLRSEDGGKTWQLMDKREEAVHVTAPHPWIHPDVHSVSLPTGSQDTIFAPTGGGLYYSTSGGTGWTQLHDHYCRAVWVDPLRADHLILGIADGADRNGRIVESINGGSTWQPIMANLPVSWSNHMVENFLQMDNTLIALLSNGAMLAASLEDLAWQPFLEAYTNIRAIDWMEAPNE